MNHQKPRQKAAIVASKDSFFISSLQNKLLESGIEGILLPPDINAIHKAVGRRDPLIYYMGDEVFKHNTEEFLNGLRVMCLEFKRMLILIGDDPEYQMAVKFIPKSSIVAWLTRPVNIDALIETLNNCYTGKVKIAGKRNILIVDDDTTFMRMMHEKLKDYYTINMLTSGKQCMLWLKDKRPDLILLDYEMPGENGVEVYSMLKDSPEYRDIPVIFLTGVQNKDSVINAIDLNPEDYILKSVEQSKLIDRLEEFFKKESQKPGYTPASEAGQSSYNSQLNEIEALLASMNMH